MFCPQCGSKQSDELKFCKACGANLSVVRLALASKEAGEKLDWSKTWMAEMFLSGEEAVRRQAEIEELQGLTPEVKRYNEIKGGIITACVGIGVSIFLFIFMEGIALSGQNPPGEAEILRRIWVAGAIPFFIGLAIIINGLFVSKKIVEFANRERQKRPPSLPEPGAQPQSLRPADTSEFVHPGFSVTEGTTKHLQSSERKT